MGYLTNFSTFIQRTWRIRKNERNDQNLPSLWFMLYSIFCILLFIKSKFVVKLLMQCNESQSKVARFVLKLISKSYMEQSWIKLHLMMILRKQKSSPDQLSIIVHHLTKCLSSSSHSIFDVLWRLACCYWIRKRSWSLGHKIKYWWRALRLGYSIFSYPKHLTSQA